MISRGAWASAFGLTYGELNCAFTPTNQLGIAGWAAGERQPDLALEGPTFNPLSCTLWVPGATRFNEDNVWNYPTLEVGIHATILVLEQPAEGDYAPIRQWLRNGGCMCAMFRAVALSGWGTFMGQTEEQTNAFAEAITRAPSYYLDAPIPGS